MSATRIGPAIVLSFVACGALSTSCAKSNEGAPTELFSASLTRAPTSVAPAEEPGCFVMGTPVRMYDGTSRPIERVVAGDRVLSYSPRRGMIAGTVVAIASREARDTTRINDALALTPTTQLYVAGRWTPASEVSPGSRLLGVDRSNREPALVTSVDPVHDAITTYELRVAPEHDFFAAGVLVRDGEPTP